MGVLVLVVFMRALKLLNEIPIFIKYFIDSSKLYSLDHAFDTTNFNVMLKFSQLDLLIISKQLLEGPDVPLDLKYITLGNGLLLDGYDRWEVVLQV